MFLMDTWIDKFFPKKKENDDKKKQQIRKPVKKDKHAHNFVFEGLSHQEWFPPDKGKKAFGEYYLIKDTLNTKFIFEKPQVKNLHKLQKWQRHGHNAYFLDRHYYRCSCGDEMCEIVPVCPFFIHPKDQ